MTWEGADSLECGDCWWKLTAKLSPVTKPVTNTPVTQEGLVFLKQLSEVNQVRLVYIDMH